MKSLKPLFEPLERVLEWGGAKKDVAFIVVSAIALIASFCMAGLPVDPAWIAVLLCGVPIMVEALIALATEFDIKADLLVTIALIASLAIGQYFAAGEVAVIMQLGGLLEELTVARAQRDIQKLVELTPRTARVVRAGGAEEEIVADDVELGQIVRVLPGEAVPVDGVVVSGATSIDESAVTGESMPVDKQPGSEVASGTTNQFGAIDVRATRAGQNSFIQRMARLVQSADAGKAKIVCLADRWATWIVVGALASAVGVAVGGVGNDIAIEAADIAIVSGDISEVPHLVALARHMMRVIKANLAFSMTLNFTAIILAFIAVLDPVSGALVHNAGSVFVIVNSAFLLMWERRP